MATLVETDRRPVSTKLDQLLDIVGLMQSTIDLTFGQSHRGSINPIDYPKIKDVEDGVPVAYGIKVEYKEKDLTGGGNGILKAIFSKNWTEDSINHSVQVTLYLAESRMARMERLEIDHDPPNGLKTTREYYGDDHDEASINWALGIAEKYIFIQRSKARI